MWSTRTDEKSPPTETTGKGHTPSSIAVEGDNRIGHDPAPEVVLDECTPTDMVLLLRFWVTDESLQRGLRHEYMEKAKVALDALAAEEAGQKKAGQKSRDDEPIRFVIPVFSISGPA